MALPLKIYIAPGGKPADPSTWQWVDITGDALNRDRLTIEIGRANEAQDVNATELKVSVNNAGGHYSRRSPLGRWYGKLRKNLPMRAAYSVARDTFARTVAAGWGTATSGQTWTAAGPATASVSAGAGRIELDDTISKRMQLDGDLLDVDLTATVQVPLTLAGNATTPRIWAGLFGRARPSTVVASLDCFALVLVVQPGGTAVQYQLQRVQDGQTYIAATFTDTALGDHVAGRRYRLRLRIEGNRLYGMGWDAAGPPPATWQLVAPNENAFPFPGTVGCRGHFTANPNNVTGAAALFSDLAVESDLAVVTVPELPPRWDLSGRDAWVPIVGAGVLRRLNQGASPLRSPLVRQLLKSKPRIYIPLEDGDEADTFAASAAPGSPPATLYGVTLGQDTSLPGATQVATLAAGSLITATAPAHTAPAGWTVVFLAKVAAIPPSEFEMIRIDTPGGTVKTWTLSMSSTVWTLRGLDSAGTTTSTATLSLANADPRLWCAYQVRLAGSSTATPSFTIYPLTNPDANSFFGASAAAYTGVAGSVTSLRVTGATGWINGGLGHVHYVPDPTTVEFVAYDFIHAVWGYVGETAARRIGRLCAEEGIPCTVENGDSEPMGRQLPAKFVDLLREAERTDVGTLCELGPGLYYIPRGAKYNRPIAASFDFDALGSLTGDGDVTEPPEPDDSDIALRNDITINLPDGSFAARAVDVDSVEQDGLYDDVVTISPIGRSRAPSHANWRLSLGIHDALRWPKIVLNLTARPDLIPRALCLRVGSRITLTNPPVEVIGEEIDLTVEGIYWDASTVDLTVTLTCSPAAPWQVGRIGSARVDSASSAMNTTTPAGNPFLDIYTSPGGWTQNPAAYPFDLAISGERVRAMGPSYVVEGYTFDDGLEGWGAPDGGTTTRVTDIVKRGRASALFTPPGGVAAVSVRNVAYGAGTGYVAGAAYQLAAWVYSSAGWSDVRLTVEFFDATGTFITTAGLDGTAFTLAGGIWTHLVKAITTPSNTATGRLRVRIGSTPPATNLFYISHPIAYDTSEISATGNQTMTVRRGIDGFTKPLPAGAPVRLWTPARVAL